VAILARPGILPHIAGAEPPADVAVGSTPMLRADKARLTSLYLEHGGRIHRFLRDLLGDAALAADATQETFVRAYRKLGDLDESARVVPWLFGIARNVSLELRKARYRAGRHFVALAGPLPDGVAAGASPESDYLGREALRVVGAALSQLSEERRAMLLLRLDHGLSYDDIALTMNTTLARVKIEIWRARETLRKTMADYEQS
jgi:RNA polymerase sigma-70 factor (ECF subfamily)